MGTTIGMAAQYKDKEGNWHYAKASSTMCKETEKNSDCGCESSWYCQYFKSYYFFRILYIIPHTSEYVNDEEEKSNITSLRDLKDFDWEQDVKIGEYDRFVKGEGTYKAYELADDFLKYTMKELESLSEKHGGPDNVRIVYDFSC